MVFEIDWIDPVKNEARWNGRMLPAVSEIDWIDPVKNEARWNG